MDHMTWIEINKTALNHNVQQYRDWLPAQTGIAPVVKANAYGHGIVEIGLLHQENNLVSRLCVASSSEALQLRHAGITKPILILGFINTPYSTLVEYNLDTMVSDIAVIHDLHATAKAFNKKINVHLKVDTGLSRLGFFPKDVPAIIEEIKLLPYLNLQGICSHFIEAYNKELVHQQEDILKPFWQPNVQVHIANSNSSLHTKYIYDFARIGAGLYGYLPEAEPAKQQLLHPIISLKTKVINLKLVPTGASIGYGSTLYVTTKPTMVATLGMGYFEGVDPDLLHCGKVLIHGEYAPIVGRINMNYFMVDVTKIPQTKLHDTATVLGQDGDKYITPYDWRMGAKKNVRIFTARINSQLPKIVVEQPVISMHDTIVHRSQSASI